jgi:hypothetical protein
MRDHTLKEGGAPFGLSVGTELKRVGLSSCFEVYSDDDEVEVDCVNIQRRVGLCCLAVTVRVTFIHDCL